MGTGLRSRNNDFELGDRRHEGPHTNTQTAAVTTFYKNSGSGDRYGSEEMILGEPPYTKGGIMRTTEVTVG